MLPLRVHITAQILKMIYLLRSHRFMGSFPTYPTRLETVGLDIHGMVELRECRFNLHPISILKLNFMLDQRPWVDLATKNSLVCVFVGVGSLIGKSDITENATNHTFKRTTYGVLEYRIIILTTSTYPYHQEYSTVISMGGATCY
jgi:hypothetical protein